METPVMTKIKGKTGPKPKDPRITLSDIITLRVTPDVKEIYKGIASNLGLTDTDLFYHTMAIGSFMDYIMPEIERQLKAVTSEENREQNELFLARLKIMVKGFALISEFDNIRKSKRGKNQKTDIRHIAEVEALINHFKKHRLSRFKEMIEQS
jgi:uncharacterized membrane protein YjjP (DUF1212 family)